MFSLNKLWNWFHIFPKTMLYLMVPNLELFESFMNSFWFLFASGYSRIKKVKRVKTNVKRTDKKKSSLYNIMCLNLPTF
jgi:hypothetical protein